MGGEMRMATFADGSADVTCERCCQVVRLPDLPAPIDPRSTVAVWWHLADPVSRSILDGQIHAHDGCDGES